jgi:hypothetical protein
MCYETDSKPEIMKKYIFSILLRKNPQIPQFRIFSTSVYEYS